MPYASDAQRRWAHTATGIKALGGKDKVHEWDQASKGKKLPERVKKAVEQQARADALKHFGLAKEAVSADWILKHLSNFGDQHSTHRRNELTGKVESDITHSDALQRIEKAKSNLGQQAQSFRETGTQPNIHHLKSHIANKKLTHMADGYKGDINPYLSKMYQENQAMFPPKKWSTRPAVAAGAGTLGSAAGAYGISRFLKSSPALKALSTAR
jgi:hypothetical protein